MIYIDRFGHLFSDSSIEELYDFAVNKLGLKPWWNHYSRNFPHFDLTTKGKMFQARKLGAVYLEDTREIIQKCKEVKLLYPSTGERALPYYKSKGLHNQDILRVDFKKYFQSKSSK